VAAHLPCGETAPEPGAAAPAAAAPEAGAQPASADASWAGMAEPPAAGGPGLQEPAAVPAPGPPEPPTAGMPGPRERAAVHGAGPQASLAIQPGTAVNFELLFSAVPGAYLALDPELRIVAVSDTYARATRAAASDLIGKCVWEALPED